MAITGTYLSIDDVKITNPNTVTINLRGIVISTANKKVSRIVLKCYTPVTDNPEHLFDVYCQALPAVLPNKKSNETIDIYSCIPNTFTMSGGQTYNNLNNFLTNQFNDTSSKRFLVSLVFEFADGTSCTFSSRRIMIVTISNNKNFRPSFSSYVLKLEKSDISINGYIGTGMSSVASVDRSKFLQGYSTIKILKPTVNTLVGATVEDISVSIDSLGTKKFGSSSFLVFYCSSAPSVVGVLNITTIVTDSRGFTATRKEQIEIVPYHAPVIVQDVSKRTNGGVGTTFNFVFQVDWANTGLANSSQALSVVCNYGGGTQDLIDGTTTDAPKNVNMNSTFTVAETETKTVTITMSDLVTTSTYNIMIPVSSPVMSIRAGKVGINNGNPKNALDVIGDIYMNGIGIFGYRGYISTTLSGAVRSTIYNAPSGMYVVADDADGLPVSNVGGFLLSTFKKDSSLNFRGFQMLFAVNNNIYYRNLGSNGGWNSWKTITST